MLNNRIKKILPALLTGLVLWAGLYLLTGSACFFQAVLGLPCPGCGLTHAAIALLHGELHEALHWHPLVFLVLPFISGCIAAKFFGHSMSHAYNIFLWAIAGLIACTYIARMILYFPHTVPMIPLEKSLMRQLLALLRDNLLTNV